MLFRQDKTVLAVKHESAAVKKKYDSAAMPATDRLYFKGLEGQRKLEEKRKARQQQLEQEENLMVAAKPRAVRPPSPSRAKVRPKP